MSESEHTDADLASETLLERISDAVIVLDADFQCQSCNTRAEQLLDMEHSEIAGNHVWTVFPELVGTEAQNTIETAMEANAEATTERYDSESDRWFEVRVYPDDTGVSLFFTDITERKQRQQEVERYERVLGHLPVGIERATSTGEAEFTHVTAGLVDLFEAGSQERLIATPPGDCYANPDEREALVDTLQTQGRIRDKEIPIQTLAGTTVEVTVTASLEEIGGEEYYVTLFERATGGWEHEQGLARADAMFQTVTDGIFVVDVESGDEPFLFERANPAFEAQTGLTTDEIRGTTPAELFGETAGETLGSQFRECLAIQESVAFEIELPVPGDQSYWEARVEPVRVDGEVVQLVGSMHDITDRKQLEAELARYETFADIATESMTVIDDEERIDYVSPAVTRVSGHEPADLVGASLLDHVHPEDRDALDAELGKLFANTAETITHQYRFEQADGSWARVESTAVNRLADDAIEGIVLVTRDVTEQYEREAELDQVQQRFDLAVEGATISTWDWDRDAEEVVFTDEWTNMVGVASEMPEFDFDIWEDVTHPDDVGAARAALDAHLDGETDRYETELRMRADEDDWQWVRTIGTVTDRDADGNPTRATGLHIDIDDRKQVEQGLSETTNTLEAIVKTSPSAIVIVDPSGEVVLWNPAAEELFGWEKDEVLGNPVPFIPENKPSKFEPIMGQLNSGETIQTVKTRRQTKSGDLRDVRLISTRIDGDDELVGYLGTFQAI